MESVVMAIPILPGKTQETQKYFEDLKAEKWQEFCQSEERAGIVKERDFLQITPNGDIVLMYVEAEDLSKAFAQFAASQNPFDLYIKSELKKLTGLDLGQSISEALPQLLLAYDK
ncbi:MAG: hypothetical protein ACBZ72_06820 [Candidatus Bathyarchaeia archaeon]|jgi:hypothetical protein